MSRSAACLISSQDVELEEPYIGPDQCPEHVDRDALYRQFQPLVGSLLRRYGKTPELRRDLKGEIYYRFCRLVEAYDPSRGIPICAYLSRMLAQAIFNHVRDHWRREARSVSFNDETGRELEAIADTSLELDAMMIEQEVRSRLPGEIARLPHRQRLVLVWRYYDNRSFDEIAAELGVKPATARSLLRHGVNALRQRMGVPEGESA